MKFDNCRLCFNNELIEFLTIPNSSSNISRMLKIEEIGLLKPIELKVYKCSQCGFVQLNETLEDDFYDDYLMTASHSKQMLAFQLEQAKDFVKRYNLKGKTVVDVGCGDGNFMIKLIEAEVNVAGIEPSSKFRKEALKKGLNVSEGYVTKATPIPGGPYDAFVTRQVFEHVPNLHDFLQGIKKSIKPGAAGLVEIPSLEKAIKDKRFYDFFADHLNYYSQDSLKLVLELNGFIVDEVTDGMYGEYNIAYVRSKPIENLEFKKSMESIVLKINDLIQNNIEKGKKTSIWGAGGKGVSTMAVANIKGIEYVVDSDLHKQGLYTPIQHFPIVSPDYLKKNPVDCIIVTALAYKNEILNQLKNLGFDGKIILLGEDLLEA